MGSFETLERRTLLSTTFEIVGSTLIVQGTAQDDSIGLMMASKTQLLAFVQPLATGFGIDLSLAQFELFDAGSINRIQIDGLAGNDRIEISPKIKLRTVLRGGAGSDTIFGGSGNDVIYGGDDLDVLYGGRGADQLFGEAGNDRLFGGLGRDTLSGGIGDDILDAGTGRLSYYQGDIVNGNAGRDSIRLRYDNTRFTNIERYLADDGESTFYTPSTAPLDLEWLELQVPPTGDISVSAGLKHLTGRGYINSWKISYLTTGSPAIVIDHTSLDTNAPTNRTAKASVFHPVKNVPDGQVTVLVRSNGVIIESRLFTIDRNNPNTNGVRFD